MAQDITTEECDLVNVGKELMACQQMLTFKTNPHLRHHFALKKGQRFSERCLKNLVVVTCRVLVRQHALGIVTHIGPSNIFVMDGEEVEVILKEQLPDPAFHKPSEGTASDIRALGLILQLCEAPTTLIGTMLASPETRPTAQQILSQPYFH